MSYQKFARGNFFIKYRKIACQHESFEIITLTYALFGSKSDEPAKTSYFQSNYILDIYGNTVAARRKCVTELALNGPEFGITVDLETPKAALSNWLYRKFAAAAANFVRNKVSLCIQRMVRRV